MLWVKIFMVLVRFEVPLVQEGGCSNVCAMFYSQNVWDDFNQIYYVPIFWLHLGGSFFFFRFFDSSKFVIAKKKHKIPIFSKLTSTIMIKFCTSDKDPIEKITICSWVKKTTTPVCVLSVGNQQISHGTIIKKCLIIG